MVFGLLNSRARQVVIGSCLVVAVGVVVCSALLGWRHVPGLAGEWLGMVVGLMSTPFLLEFSFLVIGFCLIVGVNHWRMRRRGDELVYLEQVDGPEVPAALPEHASWAVLPTGAPPGEVPSLLVQAEGALAIGDHEMAAGLVAAMDRDELGQPGTLALRARIARAGGREDLAATLEERLRAAGGG